MELKKILLTIIFVLSSSWVVSKDISLDEEITDDIKYAVTSRYNTINDNPYEEKVLGLSLFYFRDGRIHCAVLPTFVACLLSGIKFVCSSFFNNDIMMSIVIR